MSKSPMRIYGLVAVILLAGCSATPPAATPDPDAFETDAKGAPAIVAQTLTLDGLGEPIGFISSVGRCDDVLFFADQNGLVRRLSFATGQPLPSIARDSPGMAFGVDCATRTAYLFGPAGRRMQRGQLQVRAIDIDSGAVRRAYPIAAMILPEFAATVTGEALVIGGTWMPTPAGGQYQHPPLPAFYSDKQLGLRVDLNSGEAKPLLTPYDMSCRAGCAMSTLAPASGPDAAAWVATQASSKEIAFYDASGVIRRRFDITSPLFTDDGSVLRTPGGEPNVRWSARNSLVKSAAQFGAVVATIHYRTQLPEGYVFGQSTEFEYWMNLHGLDGRKLVSDIKLPGMPIGRDETHLYVTDYGADGRHSAPDKLAILRIPVKTGAEGFRR